MRHFRVEQIDDPDARTGGQHQVGRRLRGRRVPPARAAISARHSAARIAVGVLRLMRDPPLARQSNARRSGEGNRAATAAARS